MGIMGRDGRRVLFPNSVAPESLKTNQRIMGICAIDMDLLLLGEEKE